MEEMVGMIADNPIYSNDHLHDDNHDDLYEDSRHQDNYRYRVPKAHS